LRAGRHGGELVFAGTPALTVTTIGLVTSSVTGVKSLRESYGSFEYAYWVITNGAGASRMV
jgi:hypothetical protein